MHSTYQKGVLYISISVFISLYFYFNVDIPFNDYMVANRTQTVTHIFETITQFGNAKYAYLSIVIMFIVGLFSKNDTLKAKTRFAFYSMLVASFVLHVGKFIIGRSRPKLWIHDGKLEFNPFPSLNNTYDYASMPSGHTQVAFSFALILCILYPKYRYLFILGAIIIGFSRVMVSAHWMSDVVMGAMFGSVVPILIYHHFYRNTF